MTQNYTFSVQHSSNHYDYNVTITGDCDGQTLVTLGITAQYIIDYVKYVRLHVWFHDALFFGRRVYFTLNTSVTYGMYIMRMRYAWTIITLQLLF